MNNSPFIYLIRGMLFISFLIFFFIYKCSGNADNNQPESQNIESSDGSLNNESNTASATTCTICNGEFYGNGYEEQPDGSFEELEYPYSNQLCSPTCARKATQKLDDVANTYGIDLKESSNSRCERCSGHYEDGFCNMCGGASSERINQSNQNKANCEMCQGSKYVEGYDGVKICPVCNGSGNESY